VCKLFLYLFNFEYGTVPSNRSIVERGWFYLFLLLILSLSIIVLQKFATYHYGTFVSVHFEREWLYFFRILILSLNLVVLQNFATYHCRDM